MAWRVKGVRHGAVLIFLIALACLGTYYNITLFFSVDFLFGTIFTFLITRIYGGRWGIASVTLSGSLTFLLWNHPYAVVIFAGELLFVSELYSAKKRYFVIYDLLYWVMIGIPLTLVLYRLILEVSWSMAALVALKNAINGVFNALVAEFLLLVIYKWSKSSAVKPVGFQEILFNLLSTVFLVPTILVLMLEGNRSHWDTVEAIKSQIDITTNEAKEKVFHWYENEVALLKVKSVDDEVQRMEDTPELQGELSQLARAVPDLKELYVMDASLHMIAAYPAQKRTTQLVLEGKEIVFEDGTVSVVSPFQVNALNKDTEIIIRVPILKTEGGKQIVSGYIAGIFSVNQLEQLLYTTFLNKPVFINLVDQTGYPLRKNDFLYEEPIFQFVQKHRKDWLRIEPVATYEPNLPFIWPMQRWEQSSYVQAKAIKELPWYVYIEVPVQVFKDEVYERYIFILLFSAAAVALIIVSSLFVSKWLFSSLTNLSYATKDLTAKILQRQDIQWPKTFINEVAVLMDNFKSAERELRKLFEDRMKKQKKLEFFAHFDPLTKLHNRYSLAKIFPKALQWAKENNSLLAVLFIDLDRFKFINDMLGHEAGDKVLEKVAAELRHVCGEKAIIARQGGDEFIIVLPYTKDMEEVELICKRILEQLSLPIKINSQEVLITCSIGASFYPYSGNALEKLIQNADMAMYAAKEKGKNTYTLFNEQLGNEFNVQMELEQELRKAIERCELELYYQPQICLISGKTVGLEALIRWRHSKRGMISPAQFIPLAEETGLILSIGDWVIEQACRDIKVMRGFGYNGLVVSINVSMQQFFQESFIEKLQQQIIEADISPRQVKLEITESTAVHHMEVVVEKLKQLREIGIQIALDDFGTGYSSLNHLKQLPIDTVKIDRSFIKDIPNDSEDSLIVKAVVAIAQGLKLDVVAEGVETEEQLRYLKSVGCQEVQGYIYSPPLPLSELIYQEVL
ncbi:MAG: EAL domain-containing protein [Ectobacillus sp.]